MVAPYIGHFGTEEQKERLFQMFVQADTATARKYGGSGLGLQLSRMLARLLGGNIELVASAPNHGSTFLVTIAADEALPPTGPSPWSADLGIVPVGTDLPREQGERSERSDQSSAPCAH